MPPLDDCSRRFVTAGLTYHAADASHHAGDLWGPLVDFWRGGSTLDIAELRRRATLVRAALDGFDAELDVWDQHAKEGGDG